MHRGDEGVTLIFYMHNNMYFVLNTKNNVTVVICYCNHRERCEEFYKIIQKLLCVFVCLFVQKNYCY